MSAPLQFSPGLAHDYVHLSLVESLRFAVPFYMDSLRHATRAELRRAGARSAAIVGERGDVLQYAPHRERTVNQRYSLAIAFEGLAEGLAAIAVMHPGGVTFAGVHWCTGPHEDCPTPPREPGEPVTPERIAEVVAMLDGLGPKRGPTPPPYTEQPKRRKRSAPKRAAPAAAPDAGDCGDAYGSAGPKLAVETVTVAGDRL